jgi:hypothetical protein
MEAYQEAQHRAAGKRWHGPPPSMAFTSQIPSSPGTRLAPYAGRVALWGRDAAASFPSVVVVAAAAPATASTPMAGDEAEKKEVKLWSRHFEEGVTCYGRSTTRKAASASIPPPNLTSHPVSLELSLSGGQGDGRQPRDSAHELPPPRRPRSPISPRVAANSGEACSPPPLEARAPCRLRAWLGSGFDSVPAGFPPSGCGNSHGGFSHSASVLCGCRRARWRVQNAAICLGLDWPVDSFPRGVKLSEAACARWGVEC